MIAWLPEQFPGKVAPACSFQKEETVLLDMLFALEPKARASSRSTRTSLFLETRAYWREVEQRYGTSTRSSQARRSRSSRLVHGERLWETKPDLYLAVSKVAPLVTALGGLDAWITGIRRDQSPTRADAPKIGWDEQHELWKANPLADWTDEMCWDYIRAHELLHNPLHDRDYASIGDTHSTQPGEGRSTLGRHRTNGVRHPYRRVGGREGVARMSGFVVWFTGLSAAGKTTVANIVEAELEQRGLLVEHLDGDIVRTHLSKGLGFTKEDRDANIARIGWVASRIARAGAAVVVSAISPTRRRDGTRAHSSSRTRRSSRCTSRRRSRNAPAATRKACTPRRSRARSTTSPASLLPMKRRATRRSRSIRPA